MEYENASDKAGTQLAPYLLKCSGHQPQIKWVDTLLYPFFIILSLSLSFSYTNKYVLIYKAFSLCIIFFKVAFIYHTKAMMISKSKTFVLPKPIT
jgi:hypothetical protein